VLHAFNVGVKRDPSTLCRHLHTKPIGMIRSLSTFAYKLYGFGVKGYKTHGTCKSQGISFLTNTNLLHFFSSANQCRSFKIMLS